MKAQIASRMTKLSSKVGRGLESVFGLQEKIKLAGNLAGYSLCSYLSTVRPPSVSAIALPIREPTSLVKITEIYSHLTYFCLKINVWKARTRLCPYNSVRVISDYQRTREELNPECIEQPGSFSFRQWSFFSFELMDENLLSLQHGSNVKANLFDSFSKKCSQ